MIERRARSSFANDMNNQAAYILRENTGTSGLVGSARDAVAVLAEHDIPHLIVGGLAVQEHGYPRLTVDVDIVVPVVLEAVEFLTASLTGPFYRVPKVQDRVEDRRNGVLIDLLQRGKSCGADAKCHFRDPAM
jgi:hypothetical protein